MKVKGVCLWFSPERGYGFLRAVDSTGRKGIFCHRKDIVGLVHELYQGEQVVYEIATDERGRRAVNVERSAL